MGNLEMPTVETSQPAEAEAPSEVLEMEKNLISEAKVVFQNNHELVKEAMFGMGSRKAKEMLQNLSECREQTKNAVHNFRISKEKIYH